MSAASWTESMTCDSLGRVASSDNLIGQFLPSYVGNSDTFLFRQGGGKCPLCRKAMKAFLLICMSMTLGTASAELQWETKRIESRVFPGDEQVKAVFAYENTSEAPVAIQARIPDCKCSRIEYDADTIEPGGEGEITVHFDIGSRIGKQLVRIDVLEHEKPVRKTRLTWQINILAALKMTPANGELTWTLGEAPTPKEIRLEGAEGVPIDLVELRATSPEFSGELTPDPEGGGWTVTIRPKSTGTPDQGVFFLRSDYPPRHPRTYYLIGKVTEK